MTSKRDLSAHAAAIKDLGYTVVPSVLSRSQVESAKAALKEVFVREKMIGSAENWDNPQYQISLCLPTKKKLFRDLCLIPEALELARAILGQDCVVTSMNGFTTKPHGERQSLHIDFPGEQALITSLLMIMCLDDFTSKNGCTRVVPNSQRKYGLGACLDFLENNTVELEVPSGSIIVSDASLVHAAGLNQTNELRLALHVVYSRSWVKPQWDFALSMQKGQRDRLSETERAIFGIDNHPYIYDAYAARPFDLTKPGRLAYYVKRMRSKFFSGL
ncbi:MAG: phytanoyl-CoA dioxygenase family protein [Candidatus Melainabacteria bacterium]|nr:phytanoyl-CoA dioxygenase family protein [Candidatus Melainabacteria bacterium]